MMRRIQYMVLNEYLCIKNDQTNLKILKTLAAVATIVRKPSSPNVYSPYDLELPMINRPIRTELKFMTKSSKNYYVLRSCIKLASFTILSWVLFWEMVSTLSDKRSRAILRLCSSTADPFNIVLTNVVTFSSTSSMDSRSKSWYSLWLDFRLAEFYESAYLSLALSTKF